MSMQNIIAALSRTEDLQRKTAEMYYALAVLYAKRSLPKIAREYGRMCIKLLKQLGTDTQRDCAVQQINVQGVIMPDFLHEDIVRRNLKHLKIKL